jgi:hypothetical protein
MDGTIGQCICIKFCAKLGKSTVETLKMLHVAFGEHSTRQSVVHECHLHFKAN